MTTPLIVTTSVNGASRTQVWHPLTPLTIGTPFSWVLEKTDSGIRAIFVAAKPGETHKIINIEPTAHGITEIALPLPGNKNSAIALKICSSKPLLPAFATQPTDHSGANQIKETTQIHYCIGSWLFKTSCLDNLFTGVAGGKKIFSLLKKEAQTANTHPYEIRIMTNGVSINRGPIQNAGTLIHLTKSELQTLEITFAQAAIHGYTWRFSQTSTPKFTDPQHQTYTKHSNTPDAAAFSRSLKFAAIALALFSTMTWFWPRPVQKPEEIIPAQFAKIVLSKPQPKAAPAQAKTGTLPDQKANTNSATEKTAAVRAFRAHALQNAVSGLLKGGMTKLLSQSDFVLGGKSASQARRIFDTKSDALQPTSPSIADTNLRQVKVASIGGGAIGGSGRENDRGSSTGVGYGKGHHATVIGQGRSQIALDTLGAAVEEGLTKDEVGEIIHKHIGEVRYCYESAMIRAADLEGKLVINFLIGVAGAIKTATVKASTLPDPRLDDCVLRRLVTWKFPNPKGGIDVAVTYPFIFKTLGR